MSVIGVLPASGKASRIGGIPKFCLPISDETSLIQWHAEQMLQLCDEVRVSTRSEWVPIIQNLGMNVKIMVKEPSTMSDAIRYMVGEHDGPVLVGMPDTYILNAQENIYKLLLEPTESDLVLGVWECLENLKGRVGQVLVKNNKVVDAKDKDISCNFPDMWGTMLFNNNLANQLDPLLNSPGLQFLDWIENGLDISAVRLSGRYMDIGTFSGLKQLYTEM